MSKEQDAAGVGDDFDAAFAQFSKSDDKAATVDTHNGAAAEGGAADGQGDNAGAGDNLGDAGADGGDAAAAAAGADQSDGDQVQADAQAAEGQADGQAGEGGAEGGAAGDGSAADASGGDAGAAVADGAAAEAGPSADDILAGLKKLVSDAGTTGGGGDQAAAGDGKPAEAKPIYNDEETAFLAEYDKDWETVARGEALKRRAEYQALLEYVFQQVADFVSPINETANVLAERTFRTELTSAVPDYSDKLRENVVSWVKTQPTYLQTAYNQVITQGSLDEVKDLIDRYRTATGQVKQPAKVKSKGDELSDEAKKAAAALAPVDSKRSGVQAPSDPSDFDDAWKQAADLLK